MMFSSSIHLPANDETSFFLWLNKNSIVYTYHIFLIHSSVLHHDFNDAHPILSYSCAITYLTTFFVPDALLISSFTNTTAWLFWWELLEQSRVSHLTTGPRVQSELPKAEPGHQRWARVSGGGAGGGQTSPRY
jgi:hypothetical protein